MHHTRRAEAQALNNDRVPERDQQHGSKTTSGGDIDIESYLEQAMARYHHYYHPNRLPVIPRSLFLPKSPDEVHIVVANSELAIERGDVDKALKILGRVPQASPAYVRVQVPVPLAIY